MWHISNIWQPGNKLCKMDTHEIKSRTAIAKAEFKKKKTFWMVVPCIWFEIRVNYQLDANIVYFSSTCFGQCNTPPARTLLKTPSCTKDTICCICNGNYKFYCSWRWAYKPETCRAKINKYLYQVGNWLLIYIHSARNKRDLGTFQMILAV